ncbi:phenoloxidase-activating factor 3-like [Toxorhynchites rutilus septentrionalis]|uniref:phenoloxidase-activating factor 3-like n=1 Tax=Toxorhynchites rutilus septentrionalis TaxID=329112 RepID=UPI00247965DD|nr:phenoloxidase-activating factor 3-like [Toxorhynchites rutilus septentrionalis]
MEGLRLFICALCVNFAVGQLRQCGSQQKCVQFNECDEFKQYVGIPSNRWPDSIKQEVKNRLCNVKQQGNSRIYSICCSETGPQSGLAMLDTKNCGKSSSERVAFGKNAPLYRYPWMALLQTYDGSFSCGGTLITKRYVLTAAHCGRPAIISVRLGEHDLSKVQDCIVLGDERDCAPDPQDIAVAEFIKHKRYSPSKRKNDIALIRLVSPALINNNVNTICLPISNFRNNPEPEKMIITGWGYTEKENRTSNVLQFVNLPIVSNSECGPTLARLSDAISLDDDTQLCAGGTERMDNCAGDSGGPLQYYSRTEARAVQHGIVSYGLNSCGVESVPGVYTKVSYYIDWILQNLT